MTPRYVLVILFTVFFLRPTGTVRADDAVLPTVSSLSDTKMIEAYYHRCMNTVYQDQERETRDEFCSCTSAHMDGALSYAEIKTMATGQGQPVDSKTLALKVIVPCLASPITELEYKSCMGDERDVQFYKTEDAFNATCHCVSAAMGDYISQYGVDLMAYLLKMNPAGSKDPADALRVSAQYLEERAKKHNECLGDNIYQ